MTYILLTLIAALLLAPILFRLWISAQLRRITERIESAEQRLASTAEAIEVLGSRVSALENGTFRGRWRPTQERLHEIAEHGNSLLDSGIPIGSWSEIGCDQTK